MTLQATVRTAFASIKTLIPESVVAVVSGSQTANGIKNTVASDADLESWGEKGNITGTVWVNVADMTEPGRGASIMVAGEKVFVMNTKKDPAGALFRIDYTKQKIADI
jgi:hypothetical protein